MPNSSVILEKKRSVIIIEPLKKAKELFRKIDEEATKKRLNISRHDAIKDDLYEIH